MVRIPRTGGEAEDFVLVHVSEKGRHALDVKLIATEGENVFTVSCKKPLLRPARATHGLRIHAMWLWTNHNPVQ